VGADKPLQANGFGSDGGAAVGGAEVLKTKGAAKSSDLGAATPS
jgi:hypothetical protein